MAMHADLYCIHDEWSAALHDRDAGRLGALYAANATLESPAVLLLDDRFNGAISGREEIVSFFNTLFDRIDQAISGWFRTGDLFFDGRFMAWEHAGDEAVGTPTRSVETMEIENGLILHHRVYWNWAGMRALRSTLPPRRHRGRDAPLILIRSTASRA